MPAQMSAAEPREGAPSQRDTERAADHPAPPLSLGAGPTALAMLALLLAVSARGLRRRAAATASE